MRRTALLVALAASLASPASVLAQSGRNLALEEIIVTATKRESSLQDTAIAVSAFSSEMINTLDINSPFDYEALVPSFSYQETPNRLSIRGVGRFSNSLGVSPGVAIYNDGVFTAEATALSSQPINIERTEILRGPQGTLYGRNTTGGAVNIITRRPTEEFEGDFRIKMGNYNLQEYAFLVSGPITDTFRYKVHVNDRRRDGLQDNEAGPDMRTLNNTYYEGQLEWDATERLNFWFKVSHLDSEFRPGVGGSEDPYDCVNFWSGLTRSVQYQACENGLTNPTTDDFRTVAVNTAQKQTLDDNLNINFRASYNFDSAQLTYLYGNLEYRFNDLTDYDQTADDFEVRLDVGQYQEQQTHELQLTSTWDKNWGYVAGLFFFSDENSQPYRINAPGLATLDTISNGVGGFWENPLDILYYQEGRLDNESWAAFGEVDFDLTDKWSLTLGLRYSVDDYNGEEVQIRYYDLYREFGFNEAPFALDVSQAQVGGDPDRYVNSTDAVHEDTFKNTNGKINLSYRPADGQLVWATVSTGYKMGGVRLGSLEALYSQDAGVPSTGRFEQEDMIMYELGWKGDLLDNTLRTELIAFLYDYTDMQQLRNFVTPPPASINLDEVVNVDTQMYGLEATATWVATDNLRMIATYSYNNTEITSDAFFDNFTFGERDENNEVIPENVKGNQLPLTPEQKAALSVYYYWPTDWGEFNIGGTYSYVGERYFDLGNHISEGAYNRLDLNASWMSSNGRYQVRLLGTNVTDEDAYNTRNCAASLEGVYGTDSFIIRCTGNPMNQALYEAQFIVRL